MSGQPKRRQFQFQRPAELKKPSQQHQEIVRGLPPSTAEPPGIWQQSHQQEQQIEPSQTIATLQARVIQLESELAKAKEECQRLTLLLNEQNRQVPRSDAPPPPPELEINVGLKSMFENLMTEVTNKREAVKALQAQLEATSFTSESIVGKKMASRLSLLEAENKALYAHLNEDSAVEHLQMQLAYLKSDNLALRLRLQETEALVESLDEGLEKSNKL